jgi:hypothetical protein
MSGTTSGLKHRSMVAVVAGLGSLPCWLRPRQRGWWPVEVNGTTSERKRPFGVGAVEGWSTIRCVIDFGRTARMAEAEVNLGAAPAFPTDAWAPSSLRSPLWAIAAAIGSWLA